MLTQAWNPTADSAVALLLHYIFDLGGYNARELVERWLIFYPANWVRLAAIEALYQGRYKAVSVEQILGIWQRRGQIQPHFNCEFERLVCGNIQPRLSGKQDRPLLPAIHTPAIAPITPKPLASKPNSHSDLHSNKAKTTDSSPRIQPIDATRHLDRAKANLTHGQLAAVVAIATNGDTSTTMTTIEDKTIEVCEASKRESQRRDRHNSEIERHSFSPSGSLPKSGGSHHQLPIRQFNPGATKTSDFYTKLKAISQHN